MTDEDNTPNENGTSGPNPVPPGYRRLRQQCPTCDGKGTVLVPRLGMSSDGTSGTVHVEERCKTCQGEQWLDRGFVRA